MNRSYRDPRWDRARSDDEDGDEEREPEKKEKKPGQDALGMKLLETRSVLLTGPVNDAMSKAALAQFLILDANGDDPIKVYINSPGGSVDCGFAIYDMMRFVKSPVYTVCAGLAASAATVMLLGGDKGHRYSLPHTRFLLHQPSQGIQGQASDVEIGAREIIRIRSLINELFSRETGKSVSEIAKDTNRDYWMSADEAVKYGLINSIVDSKSALDG